MGIVHIYELYASQGRLDTMPLEIGLVVAIGLLFSPVILAISVNLISFYQNQKE